MVIEADFADSEALGVARKFGETGEGGRFGFRGVVRVDARGGENVRVLRGNFQSAIHIVRPLPCANAQHSLNAGLRRALHYCFEISRELGIIQMAVGVH